MRIPIRAAGLVLLAIAAPLAAQESPIPPEAPAPGLQREAATPHAAGALDRLFESLREAPSPELARGIEQVIWSIWLRSGDDEIDRLVALSIQAMNAQDFPSALSYLDKVVALDPSFAEGWNKRATVHFLAQDYARSLEDIRRVLSLEPRHFGALSGLGMILERTGASDQALEAFRRALAVHPQMPAIRERVEALSLEVEGQPL
jgi:Flp pilus assembly protein TadD